MATAIHTAPRVLEAEGVNLLDRIVDKTSEAAARYMPTLTVRQFTERQRMLLELKELLIEGVDYGVIPSTDRPTLLKPGAEKICAFFGYSPRYEEASIEDWRGEQHGEPLFYYKYTCTLEKDRSPVGQGIGSCNSWESKYRYRIAGRKCPKCGQSAIMNSKFDGGGFYCNAKKGGCNAKFGASDPAISSQQMGRVPNPDFADIINTVQKMGQKRAYIAATLSATGASQYFTQDVEDQINDGTTEPIDTGGHAVGTQAAADAVRDRKLAEARAAAQPKAQEPQENQEVLKLWEAATLNQRQIDPDKLGGVVDSLYSSLYDAVGDAEARACVEAAGWKLPIVFRDRLRGDIKKLIKALHLKLQAAGVGFVPTADAPMGEAGMEGYAG